MQKNNMDRDSGLQQIIYSFTEDDILKSSSISKSVLTDRPMCQFINYLINIGYKNEKITADSSSFVLHCPKHLMGEKKVNVIKVCNRELCEEYTNGRFKNMIVSKVEYLMEGPTVNLYWLPEPKNDPNSLIISALKINKNTQNNEVVSSYVLSDMITFNFDGQLFYGQRMNVYKDWFYEFSKNMNWDKVLSAINSDDMYDTVTRMFKLFLKYVGNKPDFILKPGSKDKTLFDLMNSHKSRDLQTLFSYVLKGGQMTYSLFDDIFSKLVNEDMPSVLFTSSIMRNTWVLPEQFDESQINHVSGKFYHEINGSHTIMKDQNSIHKKIEYGVFSYFSLFEKYFPYDLNMLQKLADNNFHSTNRCILKPLRTLLEKSTYSTGSVSKIKQHLMFEWLPQLQLYGHVVNHLYDSSISWDIDNDLYDELNSKLFLSEFVYALASYCIPRVNMVASVIKNSVLQNDIKDFVSNHKNRLEKYIQVNGILSSSNRSNNNLNNVRFKLDEENDAENVSVSKVIDSETEQEFEQEDEMDMSKTTTFENIEKDNSNIDNLLELMNKQRMMNLETKPVDKRQKSFVYTMKKLDQDENNELSQTNESVLSNDVVQMSSSRSNSNKNKNSFIYEDNDDKTVDESTELSDYVVNLESNINNNNDNNSISESVTDYEEKYGIPVKRLSKKKSKNMNTMSMTTPMSMANNKNQDYVRESSMTFSEAEAEEPQSRRPQLQRQEELESIMFSSRSSNANSTGNSLTGLENTSNNKNNTYNRESSVSLSEVVDVPEPIVRRNTNKNNIIDSSVSVTGLDMEDRKTNNNNNRLESSVSQYNEPSTVMLDNSVSVDKNDVVNQNKLANDFSTVIVDDNTTTSDATTSTTASTSSYSMNDYKPKTNDLANYISKDYKYEPSSNVKDRFVSVQDLLKDVVNTDEQKKDSSSNMTIPIQRTNVQPNVLNSRPNINTMNMMQKRNMPLYDSESEPESESESEIESESESEPESQSRSDYEDSDVYILTDSESEPESLSESESEAESDYSSDSDYTYTEKDTSLVSTVDSDSEDDREE